MSRGKFIMRKFETDMRKTLRMDTQWDVDERRLRLQNVLVSFVAGKNQEEIIEEARE